MSVHYLVPLLLWQSRESRWTKHNSINHVNSCSMSNLILVNLDFYCIVFNVCFPIHLCVCMPADINFVTISYLGKVVYFVCIFMNQILSYDINIGHCVTLTLTVTPCDVGSKLARCFSNVFCFIWNFLEFILFMVYNLTNASHYTKVCDLDLHGDMTQGQKTTKIDEHWPLW